MYETPDKTDFGTICFASFRLTFRFLIVMRIWLQAEFIVIGSICAMLYVQCGSFIWLNQFKNDRSGQSQETNCGQETQNELIWVKVTTRLNGKIINFGHFTCPLIISGSIRSWNCSKCDSKNFQTYIELHFKTFLVLVLNGLFPRQNGLWLSRPVGLAPRIPNRIHAKSFFRFETLGFCSLPIMTSRRKVKARILNVK